MKVKKALLENKKNVCRMNEEAQNVSEIAKFVADAVEGLKNNEATNYRYKLDNRLAIFVGWSAGFGDEERDDVIQNTEYKDFAIVAGIKVWTSDDMWTDYDYLNFPYFKNGDSLVCECTIVPNENYEKLVRSLLADYNSMLDYDIREDGFVENASSASDEVVKSAEDDAHNESLNRGNDEISIPESFKTVVVDKLPYSSNHETHESLKNVRQERKSGNGALRKRAK